MKRFFSLLCALLLVLSLAACSGKESPSSQKESRSSSSSKRDPEPSSSGPSSQGGPDQPTADQPEGSSSEPLSVHEESFFIGGNNAQGTDVVITVPDSWRAANLEKLVSDSGCQVRFEGVYKAGDDRDAYFRRVEAEYDEIAASGGLDGLGVDGRYYHFLRQLDNGTKEDVVKYYVFDNHFLAVMLLTPAPGIDIDPQRAEFEAFLPTLKLGGTATQTAGDAVIETIPQEEQLNYFRKYIEPYYITGLLYETWTDPEEIEVWRYMHFFTYNEDENYYMGLGNSVYQGHSVPAEIVEEYITSYFEVSPAYLRTSEKYDAAANSYRAMEDEGHGGGPGVTIERIEKDGDLWKFVCRNEGGNSLSVTLRMFDEDNFHYVAGEGLDL